jgi:proteasome assembly chaperone (PAC2) family protein
MKMTGAVKFTKRPRLRQPLLVVAWPGMGEVAFRAASYLVETLKAEECAAISGQEFFYLFGSVVQEGLLDLPQLPESKFYFWKNKQGKNDLMVFLSNAQPDLSRAENYAREIIQAAKALRVETVVSLASMPQPVDHSQPSRVWYAATCAELKNELAKCGLLLLREGQISGMNGLFLGLAKQAGMKGFCLLGEIPLYTIQIENPKASAVVLEVIGQLLNIKIDVSGLLRQARNMEGEINRLLEFLQLGPQGPAGPIGEEEIEKIKKGLSQLTKLPASVKEKLERMFGEARQDISRAGELKVLLDRWNVYREYEDRFLDLFRKAQDKGN